MAKVNGTGLDVSRWTSVLFQGWHPRVFLPGAFHVHPRSLYLQVVLPPGMNASRVTAPGLKIIRSAYGAWRGHFLNQSDANLRGRNQRFYRGEQLWTTTHPRARR